MLENDIFVKKFVENFNNSEHSKLILLDNIGCHGKARVQNWVCS